MKICLLIAAVTLAATPAFAHHGSHGKGEGKNAHYCHHEAPPAPKHSVSIAKSQNGLCGLFGVCW